MQVIDYVVLLGYFVMMIVIGALCVRWTKRQEDYFMGGRSFGKLLQTFAAFGAGTGSHEPITVGRTTWTSGLSGIWSVLLWLFSTPFYWIFGVWYRRMRMLTTGDFFVERYESKSLGVGYTLFGICFYIMYLSTMFSAIAKVVTPLIGFETLQAWNIAPEHLKYYLVPGICVIVIVYGILGGLRAAYWTDLIQGMCIILLSIILIPSGLNMLAAERGADASLWEGFGVMHERMSENYFEIVGGPRSGEFPLHYIVSLTVIALVGIVVQPHFIATGGGSAKSELSARTGLVVGNFLKRFCTIGWALTGLIAVAVLAGNVQIEKDPDYVWGLASLELLGPFQMGLVGLMLACLLAALMSSADAYMLVSSALVTRNIYAAYIDPHASERRYVLVGRITGLVIIVGAAVSALYFYDVFQQFLLAIELPILFAAPFWVGMYWRRGTRTAAWGTVAFVLLVFFILPPVLPAAFKQLRTNPALTVMNHEVETVIHRKATYVDVKKREARRTVWLLGLVDEMDELAAKKDGGNSSPNGEEESPDVKEQKARQIMQRLRPVDGKDLDAWKSRLAAEMQPADEDVFDEAFDQAGPPPVPYELGRPIDESYTTGGQPVFWTGAAEPQGEESHREIDRHLQRKEDGSTVEVITYERVGDFKCHGMLQIDFLFYKALGVDLTQMPDPMLNTLRLPTRIMIPFLVMILLSWVTPKNKPVSLDRFYVKMKTPVMPDPAEDAREMARSYEDPRRFDHKKLFRRSQLEFQEPSFVDAVGFIASFLVVFLFIAFAVWLANLGKGW